MRVNQCIVLGLLFVISGSILADGNHNSAQIPSHQQNTVVAASQAQSYSDKNSAAEWGLSEQEWSQYEDIKKGARGVWSPNLDPLTTLGIEASSDAERMKYAKLLARKEFERVEKELRFQLAYDAAFKELYPNITPIRADTDTTTSTNTLNNTSGRLLFFTRTDNCPKCETALNKLLASNHEVDIYLIDSEGNNNKIQDWAVTHHIDVNKVRNRQITLNHDNGLWLNYANGKMPAVFQIQGDGQWQALAY